MNLAFVFVRLSVCLLTAKVYFLFFLNNGGYTLRLTECILEFIEAQKTENRRQTNSFE